MFHKTISNILGLYSSVLVIALLIISPLSLAENRPGFVCGKFNGFIILLCYFLSLCDIVFISCFAFVFTLFLFYCC
ncbi:Uncharacterised protein [Yersinia enterocolitica]|nr:Uncharacterised protein [Yersinia enterocolitica]